MHFPRFLLLPALALASCNSSPTDEPPKASPVANASATPPAAPPTTPPTSTDTMTGFHALKADSLEGKPVDLASYRGKVTLVVNVASECGYTPQYAGLQKLHAELQGRGFAVLGFPSNEFGGQEPGSAEQIRQFCTSKYAVDFPLFAKVTTKNGTGQSPVYALLTTATGKQPNWNFCKYLVGKDGTVLGFYPSKVAPDAPELRTAIEKALQ